MGNSFYNPNAVYSSAPTKNFGEIPGASAANAAKDSLKSALDYWSVKSRPSMGLAEFRDTGIERLWGNPLVFTRGQEVIDQMIDYNKQLGYPLTTAEMIAGLNEFSESQYNHYGSGYAVDSDPFNIGRWAMWHGLEDKGMRDAGDQLIWATDARQALTSQQAIEIGKRASEAYANMNSKYDELSQPHSADFGEILGAVATGLGVMFAPVGIAGALGGLAGGSLGAIGDLVGISDLVGSGTISAADASAAMGGGVDAAGWGSGALDSLGAAATDVGAGALETALTPSQAASISNTTIDGLPSMGLDDLAVSSVSETGAGSGLGSIGNYNWPSVGGEGLKGIATGTLDGTAGALGSTTGGAGLTGTIEGLGTLTAEGMLIPAAGGAAVPLSSLTSGLPSLSDLKSLLDKAKEVKSGVSAVTTALGGGATTPTKTAKPAATNAGAFSGMYPVSQGKSALEAMMSGEDGNSLDEFMRLMAQSGKGT